MSEPLLYQPPKLRISAKYPNPVQGAPETVDIEVNGDGPVDAGLVAEMLAAVTRVANGQPSGIKLGEPSLTLHAYPDARTQSTDETVIISRDQIEAAKSSGGAL